MGPAGGTRSARWLEAEQDVGEGGKARAVARHNWVGIITPTLLAV